MDNINELTKAVTEMKNSLEMYLAEITKEISMMKEEVVMHRQAMDRISANVEKIESKMSKPQGIL